jgi:sirohydrochlorin ferrochelatase
MNKAGPGVSKAVLLIAHGSRHSAANTEVVEMAERMRARLENTPVIACFLEIAEPTIPQGFERALEHAAEEIVAVPFFLATGAHVSRDIPEILEECRKCHPEVRVRITAAIGPDPGLDEIALGRICGM